MLTEREAGPERLLTAFVVEPLDGGADGADADVLGDEPIWHDGEVVGWVTSGGFAHWSQASCALGYVPAAVADADGGFEIEMLGARRAARRLDQPLFDPSGSRMRA